MTLIDDTETKQTAWFTLFAAAMTSIIASEYLWRPLLGVGLNPFAAAPVLNDLQVPFALLSSGILLVISLSSFLFCPRVLVTSEGVQHFPMLIYRRKDFRWQDVSCWGSKTTLERDDSDSSVPVTRFYTTLKGGDTIEPLAFCTIQLASALETHVGKRLDTGPEP